ncbi:helix-turn-helix domain-containing protein [Cohnella sp. GCM10020058]|uniref:helix-turn-helix domain-containing protein n=1 Tax=Cohnella sp. GCM10020058 TaxID=3317330 RepID=UPI0036314DE1
MENPKYEALYDYLSHISRQYKLQICIVDHHAVITRDPAFSNLLNPFLLHRNSYCMFIKTSSKSLFDRCLCKREAIAEKSAKLKRPFYGMCYAGVEEYVIPVFHEEETVVTIFAGAYRSRPRTALHRMKKIAKSHDLDYDSMIAHYFSDLSAEVPEPALIQSLLSIAAQYVRFIYADALSAHPAARVRVRKNTNTNSDYILIHALEFIHNNFAEQLFVARIAAHCHCSESYINHLFKNKMGVTISHYINQQRVDHAKKQLTESGASIKEIAMNVGYNDPNYFSKVFGDLCGLSPTQYRNQA